MKTSQLAQLAGVTIRQLRHWVTLGIVAPLVMREDTYRHFIFEDEDVRWVCAVAELVRMGVSVEAIARMTRSDLHGHFEELSRALRDADTVVPWYFEQETIAR